MALIPKAEPELSVAPATGIAKLYLLEHVALDVGVDVRRVMTSARDEGLAITDAEIDALFD